ncbi:MULTISPECIES: carbohydrate ABC transporter permease [unclassified Ruegeria]|uniref:carbohydrate ABC transporter permease n=1 Tax=unclassified Ruegeria TaxID=2625375 RepID=UPI001487FB4C|nr:MULTISPECIES: sugar ABC transporter permease [unclassified Ruegeria]NOD77768.1 ABC transporter permease subunit [Ruegeria sp. HKCCD4332]NOD87998.1 ABC transporter permease subunit [Ruegeria sp. HKCCD4318]NOD93685.1 ABC transporter permease subunit [Ruegeria sp. HKCCD4884]NOE14846.1 ABC transporter permease subunit [Ruegeria sp. HKCCD4318-2]NOG11551.1 sugar ABC transporter permease [Ruegeria sp. HKCCD4315]
MKHRTFFWFILPTLSAMILFIALPIVSVFIQSLFVAHEQVLVVSESCGPFGCTPTTSVDLEATAKLQEERPLGQFNGLGTYTNRSHLAFAEVGEAWASSASMGEFFSKVYNLPFYSALTFTLAYTAIVTPLVLVLGMAIAVGVNNLPNMLKGLAIFISLLPFLVTPLVGSLILFWMVDSDGVIGATIQNIFNDPTLSLKASTALTWIMLMFYGVWHTLPFSFITFYAGLQTVPEDTMEAAQIDGATKWQRMIHVIVPHLAPLVSFVTLMMIMDNFRVFEPIVSFKAEAHAQSLSWIIYNDLRESGNPLYGSAGATSLITIILVVILMTPVLIRTWRDFTRKSH